MSWSETNVVSLSSTSKGRSRRTFSDLCQTRDAALAHRITLAVDSLPAQKENTPAPAPPKLTKRTKRSRPASQREAAILACGFGVADMEAYCRSLDDKGISYPWPCKQGQRRSYLDAWRSKNPEIQNRIKVDRNNVQVRFKKGTIFV